MPFPTIDVIDAAGDTQTINARPDSGQAAMEDSLPVVLANDQTPVPTGGLTALAIASFTRPANTTAYAANDAVSNSTSATTAMTFAVGRVNGGTGAIRRARLDTTKTGLTGSEQFRLWLFTNDPASKAVDNAAFAAAGRAAGFIGTFDFVMSQVFIDGASGIAVPAMGSEILFKCDPATNLIYGLMQTTAAYATASSETFAVTLETMQD